MNRLIAIILVNMATFLGGLGATYLKKGSKDFKIKQLLSNKNVLLGLFLYALSTIFFIPALKFGELSLVYPFTSTSYIWAIIFSRLILKEKITKHKLAGVIIIIVGVILIGVG